MIGKKISMAVVLLCAVGAAAEDIVLFDASKPADNAFVFNPHSRDMRPVKRDSSGRIILENNFRIVGDFDLSKNTDIKIDYDFEDSDYENVISLDFYPKGVKASREYNRALSAVLNRKKTASALSLFTAIRSGYCTVGTVNISADTISHENITAVVLQFSGMLF